MKHHSGRTGWTLLLAVLTGSAQAGTGAQAVDLLLAGEPAVSEQDLAGLRGGLVTSDGLFINLGIAATLSVDGAEQARGFLRLDHLDLNHLGDSSAWVVEREQTIAAALPQGLAVQMRFDGGNGPLLIVQNALDNRVIQRVLNLDLEMSGLGAFRGQEVRAAFTSRLVESLR